MNHIIRYIIRFLLGENIPERIIDLTGYTSDSAQFHQYKIVIYPSDFFRKEVYGTPQSMPVLPLQYLGTTPVLFGKPLVEQVKDTLLVYADIIAGAFFLVSRYEEVVCRNKRDRHGRFPGKESLPFRAGFLDRPVVDEYGRLLRKWFAQTGITLQTPPQQIKRINLTHDVDAPFSMRSWRNMARGVMNRQNIGTLLRTKFGPLEKDPFYTFPQLLKEDKKAADLWGNDRCGVFFFFKAGGNERQDRPRYRLHGRDIQKLLQLTDHCAGICGLHSSYGAGKNPSLIEREKKRLEKAFRRKITVNRHHFLSLREPEDMAALELSGITDDYTMGYADAAGFRLGTSRPVCRIDCVNKRLSSLMLHPLTVMDSTLSEQEYMGLSEQEAVDYCMHLIRQVEMHHGELTLLWHNTAFTAYGSYLKSVYRAVIHQLCLLAPTHLP
ncbi:MAG: polysaccharide deacetylase family protein [Tannerella sp.]|jgi:hypothetical protein|nr:polysaccharide deacetylase family protein [Tannerella sp.]